MTTIKASCPTCGEVELTPADVSLMVCSHAPLSYYAFSCPTCHDEVRKPADDHVVSLLVSGGVPARVWDLPAEALEVTTGPRRSPTTTCSTSACSSARPTCSPRSPAPAPASSSRPG